MNTLRNERYSPTVPTNGDQAESAGILRRLARHLMPLAQIRIRDLIFLVTLCAIVMAWRQDRREWSQEINELKRQKHDPMWQTFQVFGKPNTHGYGDIPTAWASGTTDGSKEWLDLDYENMVMPKEIWIYETYNPGAVYKVGMFNVMGREIVVWEGTDPLAGKGTNGIAKIAVAKSFPTNRVKVYVDSPAVAGWNEIDAVGIADQRGKLHWAIGGRASSSYGGD